MSLDKAIEALTAAGAVFILKTADGSLSVDAASKRLDVGKNWIRDHLEEFPNAWRLPARSAGERNVGELRIPVRDIEALEARQRLRKEVFAA